jgi:hypothetical protein
MARRKSCKNCDAEGSKTEVEGGRKDQLTRPADDNRVSSWL